MICLWDNAHLIHALPGLCCLDQDPQTADGDEAPIQVPLPDRAQFIDQEITPGGFVLVAREFRAPGELLLDEGKRARLPVSPRLCLSSVTPVEKLQGTGGPPGAYGIVGASGEDDRVANFNSSLCCRDASGSFHLTTGCLWYTCHRAEAMCFASRLGVSHLPTQAPLTRTTRC